MIVEMVQEYVHCAEAVPRSGCLIDCADCRHTETISFPAIDPQALAKLGGDYCADFVEASQFVVFRWAKVFGRFSSIF